MMTPKRDFETRLTVHIKDGVLRLRLRMRLRWVLALLAAIATLTGSPVLIEALARLTG